ncbi:MAG: flippase-like domain-containing protein, partial [Phycisphaerae bacterium]
MRLAVILAAVGWLYKQTRWSDLQSVLTNADWHLALVGLLAFAPVNVLIAQRLRWLLAVHDIYLPAWQAVKITFVGNFLIQALPVGTSGGDAVKAWFVARRTTRKHEAITSVFVDRVVGVVGLVLLSAVMVLLNWRNAALADSARYVGWMLVLLAVGGVVYFSRRLRRALRLEQIIARLPLAGHLQRIDQAVFAFRRGYRSVAGCLLLTMLLQVSAIVSTFLCGWALGLVGDRPVAAFP